MPKLPVVTGEEVITALKRAGFVFDRERASHVTLRHPEQGQSVTVSVHSGQELPPGTLRTIIRDAGLSVEEFRRLLR